MFFADQGGRAHTPPRPLLVGLVLMLLFFSFSGDKAAPRTGNLARGAARTGELKEEVSKKIIYDLSLDNERLNRELLQLKQYVLDVRRAARGCGCQLNDTVLTLFPELNHNITEGPAEAAAAAAAGGAVAAAGGGEGAGDSAAASSTAAAAGSAGEQPQQAAGSGAAGAAGAGGDAAAASAAGGIEASNSSDSGSGEVGGSAGQGGAAGGALGAGARRLQAAAAPGHVQ